MQTKEITYYVKLKAQNTDLLNYTTYVFENLEFTNSENKYIMCVRFPNWECVNITNGDIGYLKFKEVEAGIDKWYDGKDFIFYNYDNLIFINFVKEKEICNIENIVLD